MAKSKRRGRKTKPYHVQVTPTHHIRLTKLHIQITPDRHWFAVRVPPGRERKVRAGLKTAGLDVTVPEERCQVERRGRMVDVIRRPVPGYVFAGAGSAHEGIAAIRGYRDSRQALDPSERPFLGLVGPFTSAALQAMADNLPPEPMAVLYDGDRPVFAFSLPGAIEAKALCMDSCNPASEAL